jgi:thioester reductase-like protein
MSGDSSQSPVAGLSGVGKNVFLTGATGFLGAEIVKRILRGSPGSHLTVLVRSTPRETAAERIDRQLVRTLGAEEAATCGARVEVVEGDISNRGMGMDSDRAAKLLSRVDHVIHCAASIRFDLPLELARRDNTEGTRNVLTFTERLERLGRLDYIGTAYVAGSRRGLIKEDELDVGQSFTNSYEQTKMESEKLVREFAKTHPTIIYRPSIVVGDSRTGETSTFQGFYQALLLYRQLYDRGMSILVPADPNTPVDLVPIDYVIDALFALMSSPANIGGVFHLTSGPGHTCTFDELMRMTAEFTNIRPPPYVSKETYTRYLRPLLLLAFSRSKKRKYILTAETYMNYASSNFVFDKTNTNRALAGTGITTPDPRAYFPKLLQYQAKALGLR